MKPEEIDESPAVYEDDYKVASYYDDPYDDDNDDYYCGSCDDLDELDPEGYPDDWDW